MFCRWIAGAAFAVATLLAAPAWAGTSRPVDCELTVDGTTYIDGVCQFDADPDGSFRISGDEHFVYVNVTGKGVADASWNADPQSTHAQDPLGTLRRSGACWVGRRARVCARALSAQQTAAIMAQQPDGLMLYPESASQACIGVEGPLEEGATPVLHNCKVPADLIFVAAPDGTLSIDKHPDLCIDLEAPGMMKPAQLVLMQCGPGTNSWRWEGQGLDSGIIRSSDGLCFQIPDDPDAPFPYVIGAPSCSQASTKFFMSKD